MIKSRPNILSIAGFDPTGGAGVLSDIKTIENLKCYGQAVITSNTIQSADKFESVNWIDFDLVKKQLRLLLEEVELAAVKIGLIPFIWLDEVLTMIRQFQKEVVIIWDPILSASAGFDFNQKIELSVLDSIDWITPNYNEILAFGEGSQLDIAKNLSSQSKVYLKGGHSDELGKDQLFLGDNNFVLNPHEGNYSEKHGSGCVLSSALACYVARGFSDLKAAYRAKRYIESILSSNNTKLAYHK